MIGRIGYWNGIRLYTRLGGRIGMARLWLGLIFPCTLHLVMEEVEVVD